MDGWTDGRTDGWMNKMKDRPGRWMDGLVDFLCFTESEQEGWKIFGMRGKFISGIV
jgi:hypothetical protein